MPMRSPLTLDRVDGVIMFAKKGKGLKSIKTLFEF